MEFTEKHAELVGLHFGDGSLIRRKGTERLRFQLRGDAISDRAHYENFIIPLCNELIGFPILGRPVTTTYYKKRNCFGVAVESAQLAGFFEKLGVKVGRKEELEIPEWIKNDENFSKAFVRGLFDTDGCIYYGTNHTAKSNLHIVGRIIITSTSKNLMHGVSAILSKIRLKHSIKERRKTNGEKNVFVVEVQRPHEKKFMSLIGSHNQKHLNKFKIAQIFGFCPPYTTPLERRKILKGELNPLSLYARVPKRSNGQG
ncbi:MAG: LAGLIDADG family homing endonuclease [Candidatus Diapherotrites archaeon]